MHFKEDEKMKGRHRRMRFDHGFLDIAEVEQVADLMRRTFPEVSP